MLACTGNDHLQIWGDGLLPWSLKANCQFSTQRYCWLHLDICGKHPDADCRLAQWPLHPLRLHHPVLWRLQGPLHLYPVPVMILIRLRQSGTPTWWCQGCQWRTGTSTLGRLPGFFVFFYTRKIGRFFFFFFCVREIACFVFLLGRRMSLMILYPYILHHIYQPLPGCPWWSWRRCKFLRFDTCQKPRWR